MVDSDNLEGIVKKSVLEERYNTIINTTPNPIVIINPKNDEIIDTNIAADERYLSRPSLKDKNTLVGLSYWDLHHEDLPEAKKEYNKAKKQLKLTKKEITYEHTSPYDDKHYVRIMRGTFSKKKPDKLKEIFLFSRDITVETNYKNTLVNMISIMAHDVRTYFNGLNFLEMIETKDEQSETFLNYAKGSVEKIDSFLTNIISWARCKIKNSEPKYEKIKPYDAIQQVLSSVKYINNTRDISINNYVENETEIITDKGTLQTVLRNLTMNALKYTEEGSIDYKFKEDEKYNIISITDTGVGMSKKTRKKLFTPIESKLGKNNEKGAGIGLSLSYQFLKNIGGKIEVKSELEKGSTFSIYLPKTYQSKI